MAPLALAHYLNYIPRRSGPPHRESFSYNRWSVLAAFDLLLERVHTIAVPSQCATALLILRLSSFLVDCFFLCLSLSRVCLVSLLRFSESLNCLLLVFAVRGVSASVKQLFGGYASDFHGDG